VSNAPQSVSSAALVAKNFVKQHGKARLKKFLRMMQAGESGERIAAEFNVSRERVRQWKNTFGRMVQSYDIDPEVAKLAGIRR
jgi:hypothetical protein